jgi:YidC/Oxa1 family membrane protein insertase
MEKRAILAAVLMAALLVVYQVLFTPQQEPERPPAQKAETRPAPSSAPAATPTAAPTPPAPAPAPAVAERSAEVESPLYRAAVASTGGALREWQLNYRGAKPMVVANLLGPLGLSVERHGAPARRVDFDVSPQTVRLDKNQPSGELTLVGEDGFGLRITQVLRFRADEYVVEARIKVENRHTVAQGAELVQTWRAPVEWPKDRVETFQGQHPTRVVGLMDGHVRREDLANAHTTTSDGAWIGLESEWYLAALISRSPGTKLIEAKLPAPPPPAGQPSQGPPGSVVQVGLRTIVPALSPGQSWEGRTDMYVGPKEYDRLKALNVGLEKSIYFGGFPAPQAYGGLPMEWIVVPILWLMHWIYGLVGNYGVAIIVLTVIAKVLFFPLSVKSMRSMKAMQAIQPQVNALRAKHKNDSQRLQKETMELYKQHHVNPLGGCLPMVVQIPIFYALYVALAVSVELQNAPFLCFGRLFGMHLWICDLAAQDPTYVLPILMGVSMFIQQKMTPVMGDPRQAKMMLFMPVVFTFMFLNLPSGLVLYWTLSNVLQIAQQHYMNLDAKTDKAPARAPKKA